MAKPKKGAKVKNQPTKKAAAPQPPPSPPRPATPPPPPPTMLSKTEQVRTVWKDFYASWYTPEAVSHRKELDAIQSNVAFTTDQKQDERLRLDESLCERAKTEWERRLEEKGLCEADWDDITPPEMVVTFKVLFGVEVSEEAVVKLVQPDIQPPPPPEPVLITEPSPSPSTPVASSSSQKLPIIAAATEINPTAPLTTEVQSTNLSTSAYAMVNPASFGEAFDEDDDEDADAEAGFDFLEAFDTDAVSPTSSQSTSWWTGADSLQTSPSTSPSSKPVVVDYPTPEDRILRTVSVSPPRQVPVELWKPPAPEPVAHSGRNAFASPISSDEDVSQISEWFEKLKSEEEPSKVQPQRGDSDFVPSEWLDPLRIDTGEPTRPQSQRKHDQVPRVRQMPQPELSRASPPTAYLSVPPPISSSASTSSVATATTSVLSSSRSKQATRYIGPVIVDPHDYGLLHPQERHSAPERSLKQMEIEFETFKMDVRFKMIEEFHMDAIKHERTLVQEISQGEDPAARMAQHEVRMLQLQRDKEDKRKKLVDEERQKRRREISEKDEEPPQVKAKEAAFKREQEKTRRMEQIRREEERRKEDLKKREEEMQRKEFELRRKEEEMNERQRLEREKLEYYKREHASKKKAEERAKRERADRERELRAAQELSDREVAMKLQEKLSREAERVREPEILSKEMLAFIREQERVREKRGGEIKLPKEMEMFSREQERLERERQEREARSRRKEDEKAKEGGDGRRAKDMEEVIAREQEKTREQDRQRSRSRMDDSDTTLRPNEHLYWRPTIDPDKGTTQPKKSQPAPAFFEPDPIERPTTTSGWKVKSPVDISKPKAMEPSASRAVADESRTKVPRPSAIRHESTASLPVVDMSRMRPQSQASFYHHSKSSRSLETENSGASSSKLTLDHMRETPPPPKLTSSSTSQRFTSTTPLPDNRTIWLPPTIQTHHDSRTHMSRSTVIEKTHSMPETPQGHVRARTTSDPSPPTPAAPPKPSPETKMSAMKTSSKGKTNVMLEEVPDEEGMYSDKDVLPADSTAIMLSNLEPEAPKLVDTREKRVRWTESVSGGSPMSDATVLPAEHGGKTRTSSNARQPVKWGETAKKGVEDWQRWTVPMSSM